MTATPLPAAMSFWKQPLQCWWLRPREAGSSPTAAPFDRQLPFDSLLELRQQLAGLGLSRLVLLGGADLASQWLAAGLVDELQLTLCPQLLGGPHSWLPASVLVEPGLWALQEQRPLEGEELLLRYRRLRD